MGTNTTTSTASTTPGISLGTLAQLLVIRALAMPPSPGAPAGVTLNGPPEGTDLKSLPKPTRAQATSGPAVLAELVALASTQDWSATFGGVLPSADQTQSVFHVAVAWKAEVQDAQNWLTQSKAYSQWAWSIVLQVMTALGPTLQDLIESNPDLFRTMPATRAFLTCKSVIGQKGAATRKANEPATAQAKAAKQSKSAAKNTALAQVAAAAQAILHPAPTPPATPPAAPTTGNGNGTPTP